jgi:hypothetical protein
MVSPQGGDMNQPSDHDGSLPLFRIAGVGLGVLGAVGGVAGWFTLAGQDPATTSNVGQTGGTVVADGSTVGQGTGAAHTRTGGS